MQFGMYIKGIGYYFFSEILCLFLSVTLSMFSGTLIRSICALCTIAILICLMMNYALQCAKIDRRNKVQDHKKSLLLGAFASLIFVILGILFLFSRYNIIDDEYYRIYKLLNAPFLSLCNLFSSDITTSSLSEWAVWLLFVLDFLPMAVVSVTYRLAIQKRLPESWFLER